MVRGTIFSAERTPPKAAGRMFKVAGRQFLQDLPRALIY